MARGLPPHLARLLSFAAALTTGLGRLNRAWTFQAQGSAGRSYLGYLLVQLFGLAINYLFFAATISLLEPTPANAVLGLAIGSVFGLVVNFVGARLVFARS